MAQQRMLEEQTKQAEIMRQQQTALLERQREQEQLVRQLIEQREREAETARLEAEKARKEAELRQKQEVEKQRADAEKLEKIKLENAKQREAEVCGGGYIVDYICSFCQLANVVYTVHDVNHFKTLTLLLQCDELIIT